MDEKLLFMLIAFLFGVPSFVIYILHMMRGTTRPHPISWMVWLLTQVIATVGVWIGEGGYGVAYPVFYSFTIFIIFIGSLFKFKKDDVHLNDLICLAICIAAIATSIFLGEAIVAVVIAILVDSYGFYLTCEKSWNEPLSESLPAWMLMIPNGVAGLIAMDSYNFLTLSYSLIMLGWTIALVVICIIRRHYVSSPKS